MKPWIYLGIAVVIGLLCAAVLWQRNSITALSAQVTAEQEKVRIAEDTNKAQQATIARITAARANDDKVLKDVAVALAGISARQDQVRAGIRKLERGNNAVREYLSQPVPADLAKLLNEARPVRQNGSGGQPSTGRARH